MSGSVKPKKEVIIRARVRAILAEQGLARAQDEVTAAHKEWETVSPSAPPDLIRQIDGALEIVQDDLPFDEVFDNVSRVLDN